jgi:hypothetical protein
MMAIWQTDVQPSGRFLSPAAVPGEQVTSSNSKEYFQDVLPLADAAPSATRATSWSSGPPVTPQQRIHFYSPEQWEEFLEEYVSGLSEGYVQVTRVGGSGDRGADVAGFKSEHGFEGPWDCYQGKHYARSLMPADAYVEVFKVLASVLEGVYTLPDIYSFLAPRGCGPTLKRLVNKPTEFRSKFLDQVQRPDSALAANKDPDLVAKVRVFATEIDFCMFRSSELIDVLDVHSKTRYYSIRFGQPLRPRPEVPSPPDVLQENEVRYVAQLIEVYAEKHPSENFKDAQLAKNAIVGNHFRRQRKAFYSAEALRLYARDSVPEGTFEALQEDIYDGVVEVAESDHPSGWERLMKVLSASAQLDLSAHTLISVSNASDRKGICHQLANEDTLNWMGADG